MIYQRVKSGNLYSTISQSGIGSEVYVNGGNITIPKPVSEDNEQDSEVRLFNVSEHDAVLILGGKRDCHYLSFVSPTKIEWLYKAIENGLFIVAITPNGTHRYNYENLIEVRKELIQNGGLDPYADKHYYEIRGKRNSGWFYEDIQRFTGSLYESKKFDDKEEAERYMQEHKDEIEKYYSELCVACCDGSTRF